MDIQSLLDLKKNKNIAEFRSGDSVRVHAKVIEGDRERTQVFEGIVIRVRRGGINSNFTVRRISHGVGVERTFPLYSPLLEKVEVVRLGRVRRAKLYYLRQRVGKAARVKAARRRREEWPALEEEELAEEAGEREEAEAEEAEEAEGEEGEEEAEIEAIEEGLEATAEQGEEAAVSGGEPPEEVEAGEAEEGEEGGEEAEEARAE